MANNEIINLLLRIPGDSGGAERSLAELAAALRALGTVTAEPEVRVQEKGFAQIELMRQWLNELDQKEVTPTVKMDQQSALFQRTLEALGSEFTDLAGKDAKPKVEPEGLTEAQRNVRDLQQKLEELGRLIVDPKAKTDDITRAKADIDYLRLRLQELDKEKANPEVNIDGTAEGAAEVTGLFAELSRLDHTTATPEVKVDRDRGLGAFFASIQSGIASLFKLGEAGAEAGGVFSRLGTSLGANLTQTLGNLSVNFGSVSTQLTGFVAILVLIGSTIFLNVIGALAALLASLTAAAAGAAILAGALIAAFGPMVAVAIPAALAFAKVLKVLQQEQQEAAKAAQTQLQADRDATQYSQQRADAIRGLNDALKSQAQTQADNQQAIAAAQDQVTEAVDNMRDATVQAYRDMQDAIERVSDAQLSLERAQLSKDQAELGIKQAEANLSDFRKSLGLTRDSMDELFGKFTDVNFAGQTEDIVPALQAQGGNVTDPHDELRLQGLILAVRDARLREKEATDGVSDSQTSLSRARQDEAAYARDGIKASDQYQAALKRVETARDNLAKTEESAARSEESSLNRVADARRALNRLAQNRAWQLQDAALTTSKSSTDALTGSERQLLGVVKTLWATFQTTFGYAGQALLRGFMTGLQTLAPMISSMKPSIDALGTAMGNAVAQFFGLLSGPQAAGAIQAIIDGATQLAPLIGSVFGNFLLLLLKVAQVALPYVIQMVSDFNDWLSALAQNTSLASIDKIVQMLVSNLQVWLQIAIVLGQIFLTFLQQAQGPGKSLAQYILDIANRLLKWMDSEKGRKQIRDFFTKAIPQAIQFGKMVWAFIVAWIQFAEAVTPGITAALTLITKGINGVIDAFKIMFGWIGRLNDSGLFSIVKRSIGQLVGGGKTKEQLLKEIGGNNAAPTPRAGAANVRPSKIQGTAGGGEFASINIEKIEVPPAPGYEGMGDPRHQAVTLARELRRRGA